MSCESVDSTWMLEREVCAITIDGTIFEEHLRNRVKKAQRRAVNRKKRVKTWKVELAVTGEIAQHFVDKCKWSTTPPKCTPSTCLVLKDPTTLVPLLGDGWWEVPTYVMVNGQKKLDGYLTLHPESYKPITIRFGCDNIFSIFCKVLLVNTKRRPQFGLPREKQRKRQPKAKEITALDETL